MSKQLFSFIILLLAGIALLGCTNMAGRMSGEIDATGTTTQSTEQPAGQPTEPQPDEAAAESTETVSEASESEPSESDSDQVATISNTLIQLIDPLDEPEYYCIDVPGFRQSLNLDGALTAHTCKPNADDELFTINYPAAGQFYMPAYERCMESRAAEAGAELTMAECSDSPLQLFTHDDGTIQLQSNDATTLCITVADQAGEPTGGPSHLRRDLMLMPCADVSPALSTWAFPGPTVP